MAVLIRKLNAGINSGNIFQRIAGNDKSAVEDCLETYGDLIWGVVKRFVKTEKDAESIVQDIFRDIFNYAGRYESSKLSENDFIALLIRQRLKNAQTQ